MDFFFLVILPPHKLAIFLQSTSVHKASVALKKLSSKLLDFSTWFPIECNQNLLKCYQCIDKKTTFATICYLS